MDKAERESLRKEVDRVLSGEYYSTLDVWKQMRAALDHIDALEQRLMLDDGFRTVFHLQRKGVFPEWENQTPGHSRKEDALACAKFCHQTADRPLRVVEIRTRIFADPIAVDAAIAAAPEPEEK